MFEQFPKMRPALPQEYARIYKPHYKENREGKSFASSLSRRMESWLHKKVAEDIAANVSGSSTLEIGAGTLNQLQYEPESEAYDIVEPFRELYEGLSCLARIRNIYADIADIPLEQNYDRITSIATFEHICNLPEVVARSGLLLKQGGALRASIPNEGAFLWTLGYQLTTGIEFRLRYGLAYSLLMKYEHVNLAREIEDVLQYFFSQVRTEFFGIGKGLSFYLFFECKEPLRARCVEYLKSLQPQ